MSFKDLWNKLTGKKKTKIDGLVIKFDKQANDQPEHGSIYATHPDLALSRITPIPIRFVFANLAFPPDLDEEIIKFIFSEARRAGLEPKYIRSYRGIAPVIDYKTGLPAVKRQMPNRSFGERETTIAELRGLDLTEAGRMLRVMGETEATLGGSMTVHLEVAAGKTAAPMGETEMRINESNRANIVKEVMSLTPPFGTGPDGVTKVGIMETQRKLHSLDPVLQDVVGQNNTGKGASHA